jgi:hypothetical protein
MFPNVGSTLKYKNSQYKLGNETIKQELPVVPCLLMDRDEMSNLYTGPTIDASYHVSVHLAMRFQKRRFLKIGQSETRTACGSHVC